MKAAKAFAFLVAGALFGAGLAISGMTDPARVIGFLDVFGKWDPALLFVMAGAVAIYGLGMFVLRYIQAGKLTASSGKNLRLEALVFVPTMAIGMLLAQQFFGADR